MCGLLQIDRSRLLAAARGCSRLLAAALGCSRLRSVLRRLALLVEGFRHLVLGGLVLVGLGFRLISKGMGEKVSLLA